MQITGIEQTHLDGAVDGMFYPTWIPGYPQSTHELELFEVHTDEGITGYAASPSFAGGLQYGDQLSRFLDGIEFLTGEDPHNVDGILRKLETVNLVGPRPWHLEMALWDIIGKDAGKPVYELLGAEATDIPCYASTGEYRPADERVDYVVVEAGFHETTTGIDVLAGTVAADGSGWTTAGYGRTFDSQRYVFATVNSDVDPTPVSTRLTDVGLDGFAVTCQEEEANRTDGTSDHATETIGYLATQPRLGGSGAAGESLASVFATGEWTTGTLQDAYDATPALVHGMQSYFGRDTTDLRGRGYSATSFDLLAQEAASANDETNHVREYVATLALAPGPIET